MNLRELRIPDSNVLRMLRHVGTFKVYSTLSRS